MGPRLPTCQNNHSRQSLASTTNQHLHAHAQRLIGLKLCKARPYFLADFVPFRFRQHEAYLRYRTLAGCKGFPILIEAGENAFALLPLHADAIETRGGEQLFQPRFIRERKGQLDDVPLFGEKPAEHLGKNTPQRYPVRSGRNGYCDPAAITQHASELDQPKTGVREKLQTKLTDDGIEAAIGERQRLPVRRDWQKCRLVQSGTGALKHGGGYVCANQKTRCTNHRSYREGRFAGAGRHIEHPPPLIHAGRVEHRRHKQPGPLSSRLVIGSAVDWPTRCDMKSRRKTCPHNGCSSARSDVRSWCSLPAR